jgi:hypothetical protein
VPPFTVGTGQSGHYACRPVPGIAAMCDAILDSGQGGTFTANIPIDPPATFLIGAERGASPNQPRSLATAGSAQDTGVERAGAVIVTAFQSE